MTDPLLTAMAAWHDAAHAEDVPAVTHVELDALALRVKALEAGEPAPEPEPDPEPLSQIVGVMGADSKGNCSIGPMGRVSHTFRATSSSPFAGVRFPQRWGPGGYSGGTGGTISISIQSDLNGLPSGVLFATTEWRPGPQPIDAKLWAPFNRHALTSLKAPTKGALYHVVWHNLDPSPKVNYASVNPVMQWDPPTPRQPLWPDDEFAVLTERKGPMEVWRNYTAVLDVDHVDGSHDGQGYIQSMRDFQALVSGVNRVRERLTGLGGHRVSTIGLRILHVSGSGPLIVTLAGQSVSIPASRFLTGPADMNGWAPAGRWVEEVIPPVVLPDATALELSCDSATRYTVIPVRKGTDTAKVPGSNGSFDPVTVFMTGSAEKSSGGSWSSLYSGSPTDMSFYLR